MSARDDAARAMNQAFREILEAIDQEIQALVSSLNTSNGILKDDAFNLRSLSEIRRQALELARIRAPEIADAFADNYQDLVEEIIRERYPEFERFIPDIIDDLNRTFLHSTREMAALLEKEVADDLVKAVRRSVVGGLGVAEMQTKIASALEISEVRAQVLIERSVRDFQDEVIRSSGKTLSELTEEKYYYIYTGPLDDKTRDFCRVRVDKALTQEAADSLVGTQERYNCRHNLVVVDEDYLKENPDVKIFRGLA